MTAARATSARRARAAHVPAVARRIARVRVISATRRHAIRPAAKATATPLHRWRTGRAVTTAMCATSARPAKRVYARPAPRRIARAPATSATRHHAILPGRRAIAILWHMKKLISQKTNGIVFYFQAFHGVNAQFIHQEMEPQKNDHGPPAVDFQEAEINPNFAQIIVCQRDGNNKMRGAMNKHAVKIVAFKPVYNVKLQSKISQ